MRIRLLTHVHILLHGTLIWTLAHHTPVATLHGTKDTRALKIGHVLLPSHHHSPTFGIVIQKKEIEVTSIVSISTQHATLVCEATQLLLDGTTHDWRPAIEFSPGDFLVRRNGTPLLIASVTISEEPTACCHVQVTPDHMLVIGPEEIIAHNHPAVFLVSSSAAAATWWAPPVAAAFAATTFGWLVWTQGPTTAKAAWQFLQTCGSGLIDTWRRRQDPTSICPSSPHEPKPPSCGTGKLHPQFYPHLEPYQKPLLSNITMEQPEGWDRIPGPSLMDIELGCNQGIQEIPVVAMSLEEQLADPKVKEFFLAVIRQDTPESNKNKQATPRNSNGNKKPEEKPQAKPGPNGVYEDAPYHGAENNGKKSKRPKDGQKALDQSVEIGGKSKRRIVVVDGEIVVLAPTQDGKYHGHVRIWNELGEKMKSCLQDHKLADHKERLLV